VPAAKGGEFTGLRWRIEPASGGEFAGPRSKGKSALINQTIVDTAVFNEVRATADSLNA
jgi:hypothetical protein